MTMKLRYSRSFGWCMLAMVLAGTVLMTGCQMPFDTTLLEELKQQGDLPAAIAIPAISAGDAHTVALKTDGSVWAWGDNGDGQLGDGSIIAKLTPVPVSGLSSGVTAIAAGGLHTLALKSDGSVWAWGYNNYGQLGDGSTLDKHTPVQVKGVSGNGWLSDVTAVTGGVRYAVALKSDGSVWAWGYNYSGQLGDGTTTHSTTPVQVKGADGIGWLSDITAIAAGGSHTVALKTDGSVWAWGGNNNCQLGDGTTDDSTTPVQVKGADGIGWLSDITAIAAGEGYTVALKTDGSVWAWGYNYYGQLGDGTTDNKNTPVPVSGLSSGVTAIAAGGRHTIALKSDGSVWAWGSNSSGQLGDDSTIDKHTPVPVSNLSSGVTAIAAGQWHTVALKSNNSVWGWGANGSGQLGDGTRTSSNIPVLTISLFRL